MRNQVFTDWILVHRLARELNDELRGARVVAIGHVADGRPAFEVWRPGGSATVAFDLFARTPVVTLEPEPLVLEADRGFIRAAGAALRGLVVHVVHARRGDRLMRFDLATRSRFGVSSGYSVLAELVPRFGNLLLLKSETIVAAYKKFTAHSPHGRSTVAGGRYEPPPLRIEPQAGEAELASFLESQTRSEREAVRALRACRPLLPQLLAASVLTQQTESDANTSPLEKARRLLAAADDLLHAAEEKAGRGELIVYRNDGALVQAHVVALHQYESFERTTAPALFPLLGELRTTAAHIGGPGPIAQQRVQTLKALQAQERKVAAEISAVEKRIAASAQRTELRVQGETIFATLHDVPDTERSAAKERAAELFGQYKKLGAAVVPQRRRLNALRRKQAAIDQLTWELERAPDADFDDVARALDALTGARPKKAPTPVRRKRKRLALRTAAGSRILVGRSSVENAELTFEVARPNDLWFHARNTPGSHVILQRDDKQPAPDADLEIAAGLAAYFSRAQESPRVAVDYTQRKHVRKQPAAPPGLVFYKEAKSLAVIPRRPDELQG